jgi:hypothetical protein
MAENLVKRNFVYQVHCNACDNDTIHSDKGDVIECSVCHGSEFWYVAEREGRIQEVAPPTQEKSTGPAVTTRDKVANPKGILAKV